MSPSETDMVAEQSPPQPAASAEHTFRALFEATYDELRCFVERRTHPVAAEDVVAEVFLTAWRRLDDVPAELGDARAWLFTVAHHVLRNQRRGHQRQQALALRVLQETGRGHDGVPGPEADVPARVDLARAWARLSFDDQNALTLTVFEGLTGPQAARLLGITTTALSLRLLRARRRLRRHLRNETVPAHPLPSSAIDNPGVSS